MFWKRPLRRKACHELAIGELIDVLRSDAAGEVDAAARQQPQRHVARLGAVDVDEDRERPRRDRIAVRERIWRSPSAASRRTAALRRSESCGC